MEWRDQVAVVTGGGHAGAALRPDRQHELGRGDRHRPAWQCVLRGNQGRSFNVSGL